MSNQSIGSRVHEQLTQAIADGKLPASAHERAELLLSRIQQPVRLALMGRPGSGKSSLLNLLLGKSILREEVRLPTTQVSFGEAEQTICTLPDGTSQTLNTVDVGEVAAVSPVFVDMQMPLPALGKISLLEVVAPDDPTSLHRASQWAARRCDVALWCTQGFNTIEQALWAQMPDEIKDHAFLMLTKADFLNANDLMEPTMASIKKVAEHEFNQILPIATTKAIAARQPDGTVDKAILRSTGGLALISAVLKQVDQGRQTAVDMADMLLHQHADLLGIGAAQAEETDHKAKPATKKEAAPKKAATAKQAPKPTLPAKPAVKKQAEESSNVVSLKPKTRKTYEDAVAYIVKQSHALIDLAEKMGDKAPKKIISATVEHVQWVSDHLNSNGDDDDAPLKAARIAAMDAADLVQLMQMEKRDSATIEALSLLLQLKRSLQADLAA